MPYRPPLVADDTFVADPVDLPVRKPGEGDLSTVTRAELVRTGRSGTSLRGAYSAGGSAVVDVSVAGEGVVQGPGRDRHVRQRSPEGWFSR